MEKNKGPSLEKAHLYSVDKQQVSFIEIASAVDEGSTNESSVNHDHSTLRSRPSFSNSGGIFLLYCVTLVSDVVPNLCFYLPR